MFNIILSGISVLCTICGSFWVADYYFPTVHFDEWLRITPGGRKCWNITLLDDVTFDLRDRSTHEYLKLWIILYTTSRPVQSYYSTLIIVNDKSGKR